MLCNFEAYRTTAEYLLVIHHVWNYEAPDGLIFLIPLSLLLVQGLLSTVCGLIWGTNPSFITILKIAGSVGDGIIVLLCVYMFCVCVCVWSPFVLVADDLNMPPPVQVPSPADEPINHHHSVGAQTHHHHHHHHHHRPGKIADYDPLVEAPRNSPYSARQSATLIYTSDRGPGTEYWNRCIVCQNM